MNLKEALNNENSDKLQKRIRLLDVSARDCPKRKADRVEYLRGYLLSTELGIRIAPMTEAEQTMVAEVVHNQSGCVDQTRLLARYGSIPVGYLQEQTGYWSQAYGQCIPTELRHRLKKLLPRPEDDRVAVIAPASHWQSSSRSLAKPGNTASLAAASGCLWRKNHCVISLMACASLGMF